MLLVIDVGNTNTSLGVYRGSELVAHWRLTTNRARTVDEYGVHARNLFEFAGLDFKAISAIAIASVVPPLNYTLKTMAETYFNLSPVFVDSDTDTGLTILYEPASDVGADRIVDAVAAIEKYGAPCIVVDFGTATTFNAISAAREFVGGIIAPGIMTAAEALFSRAAKLPRVAIERPKKFIGTSTAEALQSGLFYGYASLVDGLIRGMMLKVQDPLAATVVATGGLAHLMQNASEYIHDVDPNLTLDGLRIIHDRA